MQYEWAATIRFSSDAQEVGERIDQLARDQGYVTPHDLVADAQVEESPLHGLFEWDDTVAADRHRVWNARRVLSGLRVVLQVKPDQAAEPTVAWCSVTIKDGPRAYVALAEVIQDPDMRAQALGAALKMLAAARKRYAHLEELAGVFTELEKVLDK